MSATLHDLRAALDEYAEGAAAPDGLEVLDGVRQGVMVARRRRPGAIALRAVATTAAVGVVATQPGRDSTLPAQRPDGVATIVEDATFPAFTLGLRRVVVVELALGKGTAAALTPQVDATRPLFAVATCGASGEPGGFTVSSGSQQVLVRCAGPEGPAAKANRKLLWRPADATAVVAVGWTPPSSPSPTARLALYQEATWDEYRLPQRPPGISVAPDFDWTAFAGHRTAYGPNPQASPNDARTITVPYEEGMGVAFQVRGPGTLRLTVNGQGVDLGCGYPSTLTTCIPDQPIGETFSTWGYGLADAGQWFDSLPGLVVGQPITITVHPSHFVGDDWRLGLEVRDP